MKLDVTSWGWVVSLLFEKHALIVYRHGSPAGALDGGLRMVGILSEECG